VSVFGDIMVHREQKDKCEKEIDEDEEK